MEQSFFTVTRREAERAGIQYSSEANKNALFPSRLRELRSEKGVSQETLSKVLGVSKSTIGLWENGDTLPDAKAIYDLARYFEVSAEYILCRTHIKSVNADIKSVCEFTGLSEDVVKLLERSKFFRVHDVALLLFENIYCEEFLALFQPTARYAAYYWLQADVSKTTQSDSERYKEESQSFFSVADVILGSDNIPATVKIPATIAGDFYCDQAAKMLGEILSKTIKDYKESLKDSAEGIRNMPDDLRKKLYAAKADILDALNSDEYSLRLASIINDFIEGIGN